MKYLAFFIILASFNSQAIVSTHSTFDLDLDYIVISKLDGSGACKANISQDISHKIFSHTEIEFNFNNSNLENIDECEDNTQETAILPAIIGGCIGAAALQAGFELVQNYMVETSLGSELDDVGGLTSGIGQTMETLGVQTGGAMNGLRVVLETHGDKLAKNSSLLRVFTGAGVAGIVCGEIVDALI